MIPRPLSIEDDGLKDKEKRILPAPESSRVAIGLEMIPLQDCHGRNPFVSGSSWRVAPAAGFSCLDFSVNLNFSI
jgi:hypothetical protein